MPNTIIISDDNLTEARALARDVLDAGGLVVAPSETMYAVHAAAKNDSATRRLFEVRGAPRSAPLTVCIHDARHLATLAADLPPAAERLIASYWPGPMTLICNAAPDLRWDLGDSDGRLAVRVPGDPVALHMLALSGPLACSAAAPAGAPPPRTAAAAMAALGDSVALCLDDGERGGTPSTVVDTSRPGVEVLRAGAVPADHVALVASGRLAWGEVPDDLAVEPVAELAAG